ncbi:DUF1353 domain-containing protein [Escherichia coli]|nr:DUF1353 domain-containing protein [Escherichia coli]
MLNQETAKAARTDSGYILRAPRRMRVADAVAQYMRVPEGYVTDLASVPRILWSVFPPHGRYAKAAIIHDWLYDNALRTKREADKIFLDAMCVLGVPRWRRVLMYAAVRLFGRGNYGEVRYKPLEK